MKEQLYNFAFFPLPIIWLMLIIILFKVKNIYFYFKGILIILLLISLPIFIQIFEYPLKLGANKFSENYNITAVVVMTGGIYKDINSKWYPSASTIKRTIIANNIASKINKPLIILGGNINSNEPAESEIASKIINNNILILDNNSKNTYQSVKNFKSVLLKNNIDASGNFLIITSSIHNLRTALTFKSQGYKINIYNYGSFKNINLLSFIPNSQSFILFNKALYEYYGIIKYVFLGYIKI